MVDLLLALLGVYTAGILPGACFLDMPVHATWMCWDNDNLSIMYISKHCWCKIKGDT